MAFTYTDFKKALRARFGAGQTNVSGDGGGDVKDHAARLSQRVQVTCLAAQAASGTNLIDQLPIYVANEECDLRSIRVANGTAITTTATDYIVCTVLKRKSPSFSVTESVATINLGSSAIWTATTAGQSKAFTLATTASVLDMDPGDTLCVHGTLKAGNGANAVGSPQLIIVVETEEK